jgi:hypothetical protein
MSIIPGNVEFPLYRWAGPGQNRLTLDFVGYDFSGATFGVQFREYRDQPGAPLLSITNASANSEGVSVSVSQKQINDGNSTYTATVSTIIIQLNETTVEGMIPPGSNGAPVGDKVTVVYDLQIISTGLGKVRWVEGNAPIYAGVTQ